MTCGVGHRCGLNLSLLWLWRRLPTTAPIRPLAWEPPYAMGAALEKTKRQKKKKKKKCISSKWRFLAPPSHATTCSTHDPVFSISIKVTRSTAPHSAFLSLVLAFAFFFLAKNVLNPPTCHSLDHNDPDPGGSCCCSFRR